MQPSGLKCEPFPEFEDNYLWTLRNHEGFALIVDPGDAQIVMRQMQTGLKPIAIFITHHHHDHIDGLAELMRHCAAPVYAPEDPRIPFATHRVRHGEHIPLPELGLDFRVIAVPGHTMSHVAYYGGEFLFVATLCLVLVVVDCLKALRLRCFIHWIF